MKGLIASLILVLGFVAVDAAGAYRKSESLRVQVNKEKRFAQSKLTVKFVELLEDSRCPVDTNCIWAGQARIKVRVSKGGRSHDLTLSTMGPTQSVNVEGYAIKLVGVSPVPRSDVRIDRNAYVANFEAEKLSR